MAIHWSARQLAECTWFVSLKGYDTVSAWNAYLLANALPQDVTTDNIGSSLYPYRTWAALVADSRTVSLQSVGVGVGRWGSDAQRSTFTKSFTWLGQAGTVIDMQLMTAVPFRGLTVPETYDTLWVVNGEFLAFYSGSFPIYMRNMHIDYITLAWGSARIYNSVVLYARGYSGSSINQIYNSTIVSCDAELCVYAINSIIRGGTVNALYSSIYYCCVNGGAKNQYAMVLADPTFNSPQTGDYTLAPTSPCLYAGKNGAHIGAYGEALRLDPNSAAFAPGQAVYSQTGGLDDIVKQAYDVGGVTYYEFVRRTGVASGNVRSAWVSLGSVRPIDAVRLVQDVFFATDGTYSQAVSDSLEHMRIGIYTALTEQEKAGAVMQWVDHDTPGIEVNALFVSVHVYLTGNAPA